MKFLPALREKTIKTCPGLFIRIPFPSTSVPGASKLGDLRTNFNCKSLKWAGFPCPVCTHLYGLCASQTLLAIILYIKKILNSKQKVLNRNCNDVISVVSSKFKIHKSMSIFRISKIHCETIIHKLFYLMNLINWQWQ